MKRGLLMMALVALLAPATAHAAFPGSNGKIAFVRGGDIWTMNPDGTGQVNLTSSASTESNPAWSPDGTKIAFDSNSGTAPYHQVWVMLANGAGAAQVTTGANDPKTEPAWSPAGDKLVYVRGGGLATSDADGSNEAQIVLNLDSFAPSWSPDGTKIAFADETDAAGMTCWYDIATVDPDGSDYSNVTCPSVNPIGHAIVSQYPDWHPNSSRLVFTSDDEQPQEAYLIETIDRDGTDRTTLPVTAYQPAFAPDGSRIVFSTEPSGSGRIKTADPDGTDVVDVTDGAAPDWQPIPINSYPRPKGATPLRASLTTAYNACSAPDRTHGPPLAFPSCASPQRSSAQLTVGTGDSNGLPARNEGYVRLVTQVGAPGAPDDADVGLELFVDDVFTNALADYTGELRARLTLQITDKDNTPHPGGPGAATTTAIPLDVIASCAAVPDPQEGSVCSATTSADALAPGTVKEGRRSIWQLGRVEVYDGGPDGDAHTPAGDTLFATQGLFVP